MELRIGRWLLAIGVGASFVEASSTVAAWADEELTGWVSDAGEWIAWRGAAPLRASQRWTGSVIGDVA